MNRTSRLLAIVLGGLFSFDALSFVPPAPRPPALSSRTASVDANNARVSRRPSPLLSLSIVRTSRAFVCGSRRSRSQPEHLQSLSDHVFRVEESRAAAGGRKARRWVRPGKAVTVLRDRAQDTEIETEFEKELQRDAEEWVDGRPGRQALWDRAQSWRKLNKSEIRNPRIRQKIVRAWLGMPRVRRHFALTLRTCTRHEFSVDVEF